MPHWNVFVSLCDTYCLVNSVISVNVDHKHHILKFFLFMNNIQVNSVISVHLSSIIGLSVKNSAIQNHDISLVHEEKKVI